MALEQFAEYWFGTFAVVAVLDDEVEKKDEEEEREKGDGRDGLAESRDWEKVCLGTFYIKPNYPGTFSSLPPRYRIERGWDP